MLKSKEILFLSGGSSFLVMSRSSHDYFEERNNKGSELADMIFEKKSENSRHSETE